MTQKTEGVSHTLGVSMKTFPEGTNRTGKTYPACVLEAQQEGPCMHRALEKPGRLSTQDCPFKGMHVKPLLPSRKLEIGGD